MTGGDTEEGRSDPRLEPLQAWALAQPKKPRAGHDHRVRGGDSKCHIYWTRQEAKRFQRLFPECAVVPVVINQVFKP